MSLLNMRNAEKCHYTIAETMNKGSAEAFDRSPHEQDSGRQSPHGLLGIKLRDEFCGSDNICKEDRDRLEFFGALRLGRGDIRCGSIPGEWCTTLAAKPRIGRSRLCTAWTIHRQPSVPHSLMVAAFRY